MPKTDAPPMTDNDDLRERAKVEQIDREAAAEWTFIECRHCSEYEGDFEADLARDFAHHRLAAIEALQQRVERLEVALRGLLSSYIGTCRFNGRVISEIEQHHCVIDARAALGDDVG